MMKKVLIHLISGIVFSLPVLTLAVGTQDIGLQNPVGVNSISELILIITRVARYIAIPFIILAIMYSGWLYIWGSVKGGGGDLKKAHDSLKYSVIGAFILLSAELVALVMKNTIQTLSK